MRAERGIGALTAVGALLMGCGADGGPAGWIDARAAVIRCTSAGRDRMPPVLLDLPAPAPPTGLYARVLDPMALDDLGFERDAVACAMLLPAEPDTDASVEALFSARSKAGRDAVAAGGFCACEAASELDARPLLPQCVDRPTRSNCEVAELIPAVEAALEPVYAALEAVRPPLVHWRLVGKSDRPGWFARQQSLLAERHDSGSSIFVKGQAVPRRGNGALLKALLDEDDVVAVARQNSGLAVLVVRELDKMLVLDHFSYPAVSGQAVPVLPYIDNAAIGRYRSLLAKPTETRKLALPPGKGNMLEVDFSLLETFDAALSSGAALAGMNPAGPRDVPDRRVERVAAQAPFGKQGQQLDVRIELTDAGTQWAQLLTSSDLLPGLDSLELAPVEELPGTGSELPLWVAGTPLEEDVVYGLEQVPALMDDIESRYPGSIGGTARAWSFTMPMSNLSEVLSESARFSGIRSAFAERQYTIEVTVASDGAALTASIAPK